MKGNRIVWRERLILIVLIDDVVSGDSRLIGNLNHRIEPCFPLLVLLHFLLFYINIFSYLMVLGNQLCDCNQRKLSSPFSLKQMYLMSFIIYMIFCLLLIILSKLHYFIY